MKKHHKGTHVEHHAHEGAHAKEHEGDARPKGFPEYKFSSEQGSPEVWAESSFQDAKPVYVGDPEEEPHHKEGED